MQDRVPGVRIVDGRVIRAPGVGPVAMVWLPLDGQVVAQIPAVKGNLRWLRQSVRIRSPRLDGDRWHLPRNCMIKLVTAGVDRFGHVVVWRDMSRLSQCNRACLEATGLECDCSCLGVHHGQDAIGWFERVGDVMVADLGETKRVAVIYSARHASGESMVYAGELCGRAYCADRAGRDGWPLASQFMCAGCMTARALVWDHCHSHGYVRAPLCTACNTRHWRGWHPQYGRAVPSRNLDTSYYRWCPEYDDRSQASCSA